MPANLGYGMRLGHGGPSKELIKRFGDAFGDFAHYKMMDALYPEHQGEKKGHPGVMIRHHRCLVDGVGKHGAEPLIIILGTEPPGTKTPSPKHKRLWCSASAYKSSGATNVENFFAALTVCKPEWDARIAEFVRRCTKHKIELAETKPYPILYMEADLIFGKDDVEPGPADW